MKEEIMKQKSFYETDNFIVAVPLKPHIPREDGGHIWIMAKEKYFNDRTEFEPQYAIEVMRLTMLLGEAMKKGMKERGIEIEIINYQENGNWSFLDGTKPVFHIHLYGRTRNAKSQKWGEALYFPNPTSSFYDNFQALNDEDIEAIKNEIYKLESAEKYDVSNWK